ncbi:aldehyde dehydrogenase [Marinomonas mediterranea]|uniref:aldehyde dehydrogenase n=1 Tax=Marinomonas mediterranea TaxID=119864 RepID=UPI0023496AD7|nr:aldehyde dehydrogenase [Marinomonas mediterranea]WCN09620.1 aldehyde dehydrogenase family protein [Marinomonas mediterranea]WCN13709.1 aldehyde dehydrogenase family protein [Marinomonas mediterranea]
MVNQEQPHYPLLIDGQWVEGANNRVMETYNPATGEPWATFACAESEDVDKAVCAARRVLSAPEWGGITQTQRAVLMFKLADLLEEHAKTLGEIETTDSGKLAAETVTQAKYVANYYRYYAGLADKIEGQTLPIDKPDMHVFTKPEPIGVVAAVVPWNAQMFLTATKLAPALAAGCSVIIKASEVAPAAILEFAKLISEAGFPDGVVSVITGDAEGCAIPLTSHPDIDRLAFTGGPETAKHVVRNTANNFAVTSLELGGKSPIIVFDDANLESAVNGIIAGNFGASGQSCVAGSRVYIQKGIYTKVLETLKQQAEQVVVGNPLEPSSHIGPLCTLAQVRLIEETLAKAIEQGANILAGGTSLPELGSGHYFAPTIVECPHNDIETLTVEMFGPVMSIVCFDSEEEAITLANASKFGLGSGLFTENLARAMRVSQKIQSGICWVNTYRAVSPIAPFGGVNQSGYGREAGVQAIQDYIRVRTTWISTSSEPMGNPFVMR